MTFDNDHPNYALRGQAKSIIIKTELKKAVDEIKLDKLTGAARK
jgi:hypothetical protein